MELTVAEAVRDTGHRVWVPVQIVVRHARNSRGGTTERREIVPLCRGYVFAAAPVRVRGVKAILEIDTAAGPIPYPIPHEQFATLVEMDGKVLERGEKPRVLSIGQIVRLTSMDSRPAKVTRVDKGHVVVEAPMLGGPRQIRVREDQVAA
jgi:hypothetical protein